MPHASGASTPTSLDDVAASLGVTKPVIYHHPGNKEQVLLACARVGLEHLQAAADAARQIPGSGLLRLQTVLRSFALINMEDFGRCLVHTDDEMLSPENRRAFRAVKRQLGQAIRTMVEEAVADGSAVVVDVRFTTFAITGAPNWPARWHREDGPVGAEQVADKLVQLLTEGLRPREHSPSR